MNNWMNRSQKCSSYFALKSSSTKNLILSCTLINHYMKRFLYDKKEYIHPPSAWPKLFVKMLIHFCPSLSFSWWNWTSRITNIVCQISVYFTKWSVTTWSRRQGPFGKEVPLVCKDQSSNCNCTNRSIHQMPNSRQISKRLSSACFFSLFKR